MASSDPQMIDNLFGQQNADVYHDNLGLTSRPLSASVSGGRSLGGAGHRPFSRGNRQNSVVTKEGITITVIKGNLCNQMVKGLVNSCGGDFDLSKGVIARAILQQAGPEIQKELTSARPANIHYGDVVVTKGYRMNTNFVFHGCLQNWDKGQGSSERVLRSFIRNILTEATKRKVPSLAFPAIGTGALGYPADLVATCLFEEIDKYSSSKSSPVITEVLLVVYHDDTKTFDAFADKVSQLVSSSTGYASGSGDSSESDDDNDNGGDDIVTTAGLINNLRLRVDAPKRQQKMKSLGFSFPSTWGPPDQFDPYRRITLSSSDAEYKSVEANVRKACLNPQTKQNALSTIVKIERIENHNLFNLFMLTKDMLTTRCGSSCEVERLLWHGTAKDALNNIYAGGFNRSYCGKNATYYGRGVYFAKEFWYSAQQTYSPPDSDGNRYIFQCRVLTGQFTLGDSDMIEPPIMSGHVRYDSVVNDPNSPMIFVVFKDTHAYPEYLVTFR